MSKTLGQLYKETLDECARLKAALTPAEYIAMREGREVIKPEGAQLKTALALKLTISQAMGGDTAAIEKVAAAFEVAADEPDPDAPVDPSQLTPADALAATKPGKPGKRKA